MSNTHIVELRSDTFTQPTSEMRRAMAEAECGDDVWGLDPTVNAFQKEAAEKFGFKTALYLPTATMSNLVAMLVHCEKKGSEIILGDKAHMHIYEQGGYSTIAGAHCRTVPNQPDGTLRLEDVEFAIRPFEPHYPITRAVCVENTQNVCGGRVLTKEYIDSLGALCKKNNVKLHIDGSRIFNASVKLGISVKELTEQADTVTLCLSKGLSAPMGALLLTRTEADAVLAHRFRKVLGGNMRQVGVVACCGRIAINDMVERLAEDHKHAKMLAEGLASIDGVACDVDATETNMIRWGLDKKVQDRATCAKVVEALANSDEVCVKMICIERGSAIRAVTHRHITTDDIVKAINKVRKVMEKVTTTWPKLTTADHVLTIE
ncbi:L-allo-threonine aldolase, putative [Perkinsus marinus ATCC 50983]|uniref:L-allo-threonine aldolase, putative n=1 Tax=Perkinsus marinus (strain ATCC 50983 / TXsc) TaxID=423536 RepID=C5L303_PERM5|nr:L-allo-threonine aldolase, putative [Perkinsus marinus ATCC 50983]EER08890.1 L-allo-threonine aldolase, putative [Perkinsus marinus ATCC 50983]|eukprot:XP_002777074.1 L-allo-threonine aldolase, putative [Perkinsus marinus ATCC 50983]